MIIHPTKKPFVVHNPEHIYNDPNWDLYIAMVECLINEPYDKEDCHQLDLEAQEDEKWLSPIS